MGQTVISLFNDLTVEDFMYIVDDFPSIFLTVDYKVEEGAIVYESVDY